MTEQQLEITRAYEAAKSLGSPIGRGDTDARKLTIEQAKALTNWCDCQSCSTFEDRDGNGFPLQAILDLWHKSIVYDTFELWYSEEQEAARRAYIAICRRHKIKPGAGT